MADKLGCVGPLCSTSELVADFSMADKLGCVGHCRSRRVLAVGADRCSVSEQGGCEAVVRVSVCV